MTEGLAIEVACSKMRELGVGKEYLVRYRHFQILGGKQLIHNHARDLLILLTPDPLTRVFSADGYYDLTDSAINEMQYVFSGKVTIENLNPKSPIQVKFLQVIPILNTK